MQRTMRIRIDISDEQALELTKIAGREGVSVEDLICEAIADLIAER